MKTATFTIRLLLPLILTLAAALPSQGAIQWRVSIKFIANGIQLPAYGGALGDPFIMATARVAVLNNFLEENDSPYELQLIEAIAITGVEEWWDVSPDADSRTALDVAAKADKDLYAYRDDAINIYINGTSSGTYSGYCSFPGGGHDVILMREDSSTLTMLHEIGHFFNLRHTHQGSTYSAAEGCDGGPYTPGNDDGVDDTLPDLPCYNRDDIAENSYGAAYGDLFPIQQQLVDNTWNNLMSYHNDREIITPDQWTRVTESVYEDRPYVIGPRHWFVDDSNECDNPNGSRRCAYDSIGFLGLPQAGGGPFPQVGTSVSTANPGDLIRIHPGTYAEGLTLTKRLVFRAESDSAILR